MEGFDFHEELMRIIPLSPPGNSALQQADSSGMT